MVQHYVHFLFIYPLEIHKYFHVAIFPGLISFRCESCVCCAVLCILLFSICMTLRLGLLLFPLDTHSSFPYWFCCLFMPVCFFFSFLFFIYHSFSFTQTNPVIFVQQLTLNDIQHCQTSLEIQH